MLQRYRKLRSGWATLAVGALVASLLAAGATTATAVTETPDERSKVNVCVGAALADWGFTDVSDGHIFRDAINCLAHYGVTIGCGDGTIYCPEEPVKRWQMMLFLTRALVPTGINLRPARAQNFTDVGGLGEEARDAIDLLVTNGIAAASGRAFEPHAVVDRAEMALLLVRLLAEAGDVVDFASNGDILLDANGDGSQSRPDDYFKDARDKVPAATDQAISAAYELGITTGAEPTPAVGAAQPGLDFFYRPRGSVTRGQMAAFIIRALGHTLARPKGLSAQYDGNEIRVSVRDHDFEPVDRAPVDMFFIESEHADEAFTSRGACADVEFVDGARLCEIDSADLETDNDGEVSLTVPETVSEGVDTTVWVWTGVDGDEVGRGTKLFDLEIEASAQTRAAAKIRISTRFKGSKARFGTTVSVTVQLQDAQGRDVAVGTDGERPAEWEFFEEVLEEATGSVDGMVGAGETLVERTRPTTLRSDSSGRVTFSLSVRDPVRVASRTRTFSLVPTSNAPSAVDAAENLKATSGRTGGEVRYLEFSDAAPALANTVVTVTFPAPYINAPVSGSARNVAVVSVFDEYGEALSAAKASLRSSQTASSITTQSFSVGRDGVHRFSYNYSGDGGVVETLTATVDPDGDTATTNNLTKEGHMFWAGLADRDGGDDTKYAVLFGDTDRDEIIVDADTVDDGDDWPAGGDTEPRRVEYDDNDRFDVQRSGDAAPRPVGTMEEFERALAEFLAKTPEDDTGAGACLEWANFDRARDTAEIKLWRDCS